MRKLNSPPPVVMFLAKAFQTDNRPRQEAKTLVEANHSVHVIAWDRQCEFSRVEIVDGAIVHSYRPVNLRQYSPTRLALGAILFQIVLFLETIRLIGSLGRRPIVHSHDFNTLLPGCFLQIIGLTAGLVYDSHELSFAAYQDFLGDRVAAIIRGVEQYFLRYPEKVLTVSEPFANYLRRFNKQTIIIYNCPRAADIPKLSRAEIRAQLRLPADAFIVSYIGSINEIFASELLLSVASRFHDDLKIRFLVVGGGPLAPKFMQEARRANPLMIVLPQVSREMALRYVAASDLTWGIYRSESLNARLTIPWKFFESLACRVPIIVEEGTFVAELVNKFRCGFVLQPGNQGLISREILLLSRRSERAPEFRSVPDYSWETVSLKLIETYERLAANQDLA